MKKIIIILMLLVSCVYAQNATIKPYGKPMVRPGFFSWYDGTSRDIWTIGDTAGVRLHWGKNPLSTAPDKRILMFKDIKIDSSYFNGDTSYVALADSGFESIAVKNLYIFGDGAFTSVSDTLKLHRLQIQVNNSLAKQTADSLQFKVSRTVFDAEHAQIEGEIGGIRDTLSYQEGQILTTADSVNISVKYWDYTGRRIKSFINVDTSGVQLEGKHIKITGETTFEAGYNPSLKVNSGGAAADVNANTTTINGNKLTTGTVIADSIRSNYIYGKTMVGSTLSTGGFGSGAGVEVSGTSIKIRPNPSGAEGTIAADVAGAITLNGSYPSYDGHTHNISNVTNLQTTLDSKVSKSTGWSGQFKAKNLYDIEKIYTVVNGQIVSEENVN